MQAPFSPGDRVAVEAEPGENDVARVVRVEETDGEWRVLVRWEGDSDGDLEPLPARLLTLLPPG
jgi:hypothetical protein